MGYHTDLIDDLDIDPPLSNEHRLFLIAFNDKSHPDGLPSGYCPWKPSDDGEFLVWDQCEKPYCYVEWLNHLIENYFKPWGYVINGDVFWRGGDDEDRGTIYVKDNLVEAVSDEITNPGPSWDRASVTGPEYVEIPKFNERELATVLASLRHWQQRVLSMAEWREHIDATYPLHFEEVSPLTSAEIDVLCERINCKPDVPSPQQEEAASTSGTLLDELLIYLGEQMDGHARPVHGQETLPNGMTVLEAVCELTS